MLDMDGLEIERKWLVSPEDIPFDLNEYDPYVIEQAYISFEPVIRIRRINGNEKFILTVKNRGENALVREEFETELTEEQYASLYLKKEGYVIDKKRYPVPMEKGVMEIDVFGGNLEGLCYLEVEFSSVDEAEAFRVPDWVTCEVTQDGRYGNNSPAQYGRP